MDKRRQLDGKPTGAALVELMRAAPLRDVDIEPSRARMPVRDVDLFSDEGGTPTPSVSRPAKSQEQ